jgi:hypothetical protein
LNNNYSLRRLALNSFVPFKPAHKIGINQFVLPHVGNIRKLKKTREIASEKVHRGLGDVSKTVMFFSAETKPR